MAIAARQKSVGTASVMIMGTREVARAEALSAVRVFIAASAEAEVETLSRLLHGSTQLEVIGTLGIAPFDATTLTGKCADVLLLTSCGNFQEDLSVIRTVRASQPGVEIVMLGTRDEEAHFLQCVRAGVHGYLSPEVAAHEILQAIVAVRSGAAVCPGKLCAELFRYFETEAKSLPSSAIHQRMGLTRREQQLIPLVAKGLTNKEIANHFSLSEQTIKNHLYRMKHKIGAEDRLSIVHLCRVQGLMV
jgi:DNA-binding NarL/FixJ family response regulator